MNFFCLLMTFIGFLEFSEQLFYRPDFTNPLISEEIRNRCGYRYRLHRQDMNFGAKCATKSGGVVNKPHIELRVRRSAPNQRIVGGRFVEYREAPWAVQITIPMFYQFENGTGYVASYYSGRFAYMVHGCSASLITHKHIVSAAHCFKSRYPFYHIHLGSDYYQMGVRRNVINNRDVIKHNTEDVAIVTIPDIDFRFYDSTEQNAFNKSYLINPICLPEYDSRQTVDPETNHWQNATVFGFGRTHPNIIPQKLRRGDMTVLFEANETEAFIWFLRLSESSSVCKGDSGAGLLQYLDPYESRALLIGVVSAGEWNTSMTYCTHQSIIAAGFVNMAPLMNWVYRVIQRFP